jgi:hypothetical protein
VKKALIIGITGQEPEFIGEHPFCLPAQNEGMMLDAQKRGIEDKCEQ